jgi:hypothetical protein
VVGERDGGHAKLHGTTHQVVHARRTVQNREVRVVVQMYECHATRPFPGKDCNSVLLVWYAGNHRVVCCACLGEVEQLEHLDERILTVQARAHKKSPFVVPISRVPLPFVRFFAPNVQI